MRAPLLLAAALLAALPLARAASDAAAPAPSPSPDGGGGGPVASTAAELHAALAARDAAVVRVGGADGKAAFLTINASSWPTPVVLESGRAIALASADPASPSTIHFADAPSPSIVLASGASLTLRSLILRGLGPAPEPGSGYRLPHVPSLPFGQGDVAIYPATSVALENVTAYVATASCDALAGGNALGAPVGVGGVGAEAAARLDPVQAIPRLGNATREAVVVGGVNQTELGTASVREAASLYLCMPGQPTGRWPLPYAGQPPVEAAAAGKGPAAARGVAPGAVAAAAVGAAAAALLLAAAVAACVCAVLAARRRKSGGGGGGGGGDEESDDPPSSSLPKRHPAFFAALRRHPSTAKQSSDEPDSSRVGAVDGPGEAAHPLPPLPPSPPSPAGATAGDDPSRDSVDFRPTSVGYGHPLTMASAGGGGGGGSSPEGAWLRRRIGPADAPDELDVGPLLGRGSFGAVYKARWFGGLCALKVVPLTPDAAAAAVAGVDGGGGGGATDLTPVSAAVGVRVGRELSLGVALSHPHLVATYRAWIVDAGAVGAHRASWEGVTDGGGGGGGATAAAATSEWTTPPPPVAERAISLDRADSGLAAEVDAAAGAPPPHPSTAPPSSTPSPGTGRPAAPREAWLLLELCSLGTLDAAVRARRFAPVGSPSALAAALRTLRDVAAGMEYLHAHAVVHGDLKACNVLLKPAPKTVADPRGYSAKVADFGLARFVGARGHVSTRTHGSVQYAAPEVLAARRVGLPADVYSFGVLAAEVLTGRKPHAGRTVGAVVHAVVAARERPAVPAGAAPPAVRALVAACCAGDDAARPTFAAILAALRAFCDGDWDGGDAAWRDGGGVGSAGDAPRVVPAVVVEAARVASSGGGSVHGARGVVAVSSPGKGRAPGGGAWEE